MSKKRLFDSQLPVLSAVAGCQFSVSSLKAVERPLGRTGRESATGFSLIGFNLISTGLAGDSILSLWTDLSRCEGSADITADRVATWCMSRRQDFATICWFETSGTADHS